MSNPVKLLEQINQWSEGEGFYQIRSLEIESLGFGRGSDVVEFFLVRSFQKASYKLALSVRYARDSREFQISHPNALEAMGSAFANNRPMIPVAIWSTPEIMKWLENVNPAFKALIQEGEVAWQTLPTEMRRDPRRGGHRGI